MSEEPIPWTEEEALCSWISTRSEWRDYCPLLEMGSAHLERLVYRHAPAELLSIEVVGNLQERAAQMSDPGSLLVPLLSNPHLPDRVLRQTLAHARALLENAHSTYSSRRENPEEIAGLRWLGMVEAAGRCVPDSFWDPDRDALHRPSNHTEGQRIWAAYFLMSWSTVLRADDARAAYEVLKADARLSRRLLRHPATPLDIVRRGVRELSVWGEAIWRDVARHPEARRDPELREEMKRRNDPEVALFLILDAEADETREIYRQCRSVGERLRLLGRMSARQRGALEARDWVVLMEHAEGEVRLQAQRFWSSHLEVEKTPLPWIT